MEKIYQILYAVNEKKITTQRELASACKMSLGSINYNIKKAQECGYLEISKKGVKKYKLTPQGMEKLALEVGDKNNKKLNPNLSEFSPITTAVILAAGKRADFDIPVAFLEIEKKPLIVHTIEKLMANGITKIIIVAGFRADMFEELRVAYPFLEIVINTRYQRTGTMASLVLTRDVINEDFLLLEGDIIIDAQAIRKLLNNANRNCMIITNESGSKDEALVELRDGYIYKMSKDIHQLSKIDGEMIGVSKISIDVFSQMLKQYSLVENEFFNYEYMLMDLGRTYEIGFEKIADLVWYEIDTLEHYEHFNHRILRRLKRQEEKFFEGRIKDVITKALNVSGDDVEIVEKIGGMTNQNYEFKICDKAYILRIPGVGTDKMINRRFEYANCMMANKLGIDAEIFYLNEVTGVKIAQFIKGAQTLNSAMIKRDEVMNETVKLMKKLHTSEILFDNDFDVFEEIRKYHDLNIEAGGEFFADYGSTHDSVMGLEKILHNLGQERCACHNDTVPENFINDGEGKFYLIDWEYSGNNDPIWDLAAHALESDFSLDEELLLLEKYFGEAVVNEIHYVKMLIFQICQDFLWSLWTNIKEAKGEDFGTYGMDRYKRSIINLRRLMDYECCK